MWQRFTLYDARIIAHYLGILIQASSAAMVVPFVTGLVFQEWGPASNYLKSIGVTLLVGSALRMCYTGKTRLNRQQALAVTGSIWIVLAFLAAIPLFMSGHFDRYIDALFEGVSSLTTTGASMIEDLDHCSNADNMWRFIMHFAGGVGLIVVALSFGLMGRRAGASLYLSEGRSEHVVPNVIHTTQHIAKISVIIISVSTVVLTGVCLFIGINPASSFLHSLWMSLSGFTTGGFAPMNQSIGFYHSPAIEFVLMMLMLLGSINFALHNEIWKGRIQPFFHDLEIKTMFVWLGVVTVVMTASLCASVNFTDLPAMMRRGLFTIISSYSTTGFLNISEDQLLSSFTSGAFLIVALLMAVGGGGGSTSGGLKFNRLGIMVKSIVASIKETLAPDSARIAVSYTHITHRVVSESVAKEAMTVFMLYVITYVGGTLAAIAFGYDATNAIFEAVSMGSNGGMTSGIVSPGMPIPLEIIYILMMWAGRLEFMTLLALMVEVFVSICPVRIRRRR